MTRVDLEMVSGSPQMFEFSIMKNGVVPPTFTTDTIQMFISYGYGKTRRLLKESAPGIHFDDVNGIVRFTVSSADAPARTGTETWWYEIWRKEAGGDSILHVVGELKVFGTIRT